MGKFFENYDIVSKYGDCEIDLADLIEQVEDVYLFDNTEDDDEIFGDYIEEYVEFLPWYYYWYISNIEIMD